MEDIFHLGVKALIVNDQNRILVLKANPEDLKGDKTIHWDLPGGRVKKGETIEATLRKEIEEELGMPGNEVNIISDFHVGVSNLRIPIKDDTVGLVLAVKLCKLAKDRNFRLSFEHTEYKWAGIEEAKELLSFKYPREFTEKLDSLLLK